jgi:integrase
MSVKIRAKRNRLYLDIYWKGSRIWETIGITITGNKVTDKEAWRLAEIVRARREQQLVAGEYNLQDIVAGKQSFIEYAERIAQKQDKKNPLPKSLLYLKPFAKTISIGAVNAQWLEQYRQFLLEQPALSNATAQKYFSAMKSVIHYAIRERIIIRDPTDGVKGISVPDPETVHLTLTEIQKLALTPIGGDLGSEVKKGFLFDCYTGLRISDLLSLKWGNIEQEPRLSLSTRQKKTGAIVSIPLSKLAWQIIDDQQQHHADEFVFPLMASTKTNTNQYLVDWAKRAGIEKQLGWHVARRTFGTLALQNGGDLKTVSALLGHKKLTHTARYLKTDDNTKQRVIDAIPEIQLDKT